LGLIAANPPTRLVLYILERGILRVPKREGLLLGFIKLPDLLGGAFGLVAHHPADTASENGKYQEQASRDGQSRLVSPRKLPQPIAQAGRARLHRLIIQIALHVGGKGAGRLLAPVAVFLQALHDDPVQLLAQEVAEPLRIALAVGGDRRGGHAQRADARARFRRFLLADHPP